MHNTPPLRNLFLQGGAGSACQTGDLPPRAPKNKLPNPSNRVKKNFISSFVVVNKKESQKIKLTGFRKQVSFCQQQPETIQFEEKRNEKEIFDCDFGAAIWQIYDLLYFKKYPFLKRAVMVG